MRKAFFIICPVFVTCLLGCSPVGGSDREKLPDLTGVRAQVKETGTEKKVDELKAEDVIVAVDGIVYTKKMFDDECMLLAHQLRRNGKNPQEMMSTIAERSPLFITHFVNRYLMILDAQRLGSPSREEVQKAYTRNLEGLQRSRRKTLDEIEKAYPSKNKDMMYRRIAEELYVKLYTATNIAPFCVVDSNMVNDVKIAIRISAAESAATNALIIAELKELSKKLAGDKEAFAAAANKDDVDPETPKGSGGYLGNAEREQIENKEVAAAVFALKKVGDITEPIVEEDSAFIVQLLSVTPAVTNETGRVVQGELRETARIFRELEGKPIELSDADLWKTTIQQKRAQALTSKLNELATNGTFKIVYPYGKKLF